MLLCVCPIGALVWRASFVALSSLPAASLCSDLLRLGSGALQGCTLFLCQSSSWKLFGDWTSQNITVGTNLILLIAGLYHLVKRQGCSFLGVCFSAIFIDSNTHPCQPPFCEIKKPNFSLGSRSEAGSVSLIASVSVPCS